MGWLNSRKPQGFHHTYIYIDERNEAVRRLRQSRVEAAADEASLTAAGDGAASSADAAKPSADSAKPSAASATPAPETSPAGPLFVSALAERRRQSRDAAMRLVGAIVVPLLMLFLVLTIFIFLL
ncbi:hypothetical protein [Prevotella dentalis]|uniref:hypothetical protein n=1 Tax=Prevotella dentalis TaxID=52227 RepID=UPI00265A125F|nr:hypothetical protein [Prevotella dentalis]MCF2638010.1 hypothetical protein [Prevotella dentalis]MEE0620189.1 hypothetical protein [Prevotella sp.]